MGGDLHIVTDDGNLADRHLQWVADEVDDPTARRIARVLLLCSYTQRRRALRMAKDAAVDLGVWIVRDEIRR